MQENYPRYDGTCNHAPGMGETSHDEGEEAYASHCQGVWQLR